MGPSLLLSANGIESAVSGTFHSAGRPDRMLPRDKA
jgi:hypothetical protein